jgi:O-acetyl-ADP-ribose deacetylase (regulator of RNase III)
MPTEIQGDLLSVKQGILCHQVNCRGVMGAGIAKKIRNKWPVVYQVYRQHYEAGKLQLGKVIPVPVEPGLFVANLCGQYYYGRNGQYTDYQAVATCLATVRHMATTYGANVYIPRGMGCSLAGGDWNVVRKLVCEHVPGAFIVNYG